MIKTDKLTKIYNSARANRCVAVDHIDLTICEGELVAIVGESGSGKSTLLHLLSCADTATSGEIEIDGLRVNKLNSRKLAKIRNSITAIVLQEFALINDFTVWDNVMLPLHFSKKSPMSRKSRVKNALVEVGIENLARKKISELSGGQKQRVAIARAIVTQPKYIFADEPTGSLDSKTAEQIIDLLMKLNSKGITVVIVTHNENIASRCSRLITVKDGRIVSDTIK